MKLPVSVSAWLATPTKKFQSLVVSLPDDFSIIKHKALPHYYLMHKVKQAGSIALVVFGEHTWVDCVFLEPEYRGKNYMANFLWFVVRHAKERPLLLDAYKKHIPTYAKVGFRPLKRSQLEPFSASLKMHRKYMEYEHPFEEYVPMFLNT